MLYEGKGGRGPSTIEDFGLGWTLHAPPPGYVPDVTSFWSPQPVTKHPIDAVEGMLSHAHPRVSDCGVNAVEGWLPCGKDAILQYHVMSVQGIYTCLARDISLVAVNQYQVSHQRSRGCIVTSLRERSTS
ncbi:unnamed protein product [Ixodes hexagonus]